LTDLSVVDLRFTGAASDVGVLPLRVTSVSGVDERRLLTICGNFLPINEGDITSISPLSAGCPVLELLRRVIKPRPALPARSIDVASAVVAEPLTLSSFTFVDAEPLCRLAAPVSPEVADCLPAARLTDPEVDGDGMDDDDDGLADFALELLLAAAAVDLAARLSGCVLEPMRRASPDRRVLAPVVELLAMLLILVDDAVRLGTDDDERLPSYTAACPPSSALGGG